MAQLMFKVTGTNGETLAKRMIKLAWDESTVNGMGFLQDRGVQTEDAVWKAVKGRRDYGGLGVEADEEDGEYRKVSADYVFGRMMKLTIEYGLDSIKGYSGEWHVEYQSFCRAYKDIESLARTAAASLNADIETV
jgi:hypothetical protein